MQVLRENRLRDRRDSATQRTLHARPKRRYATCSHQAASKQMFGDMQMTALSDMIQAALMLNYNGRKVG